MDLLTPLLDAVSKGKEAAVEHLLSLGANINMNDEMGLTVLHWAAASSASEKLVPFLIANGARINATNNFGQTPLYVHCARGRMYGAFCLLHNGADAVCRNSDVSLSPLQACIDHGQTELAKLLLSYGAEDLRNSDNNTHLREVP
jgi:ankyrin repeat protein